MQFSNSRIQTFRSCPKKFYYNYIEGLQQPDSPALLLGTLFHSVLEAHYDESIDMNAIFDEYKGYVMTGIIENHPLLLEHVYHEYLKNYKQQFEDETLLMNEQEVLVALDKDEEDTVVGIVDKIVQVGGQVIMRDHKTTSGQLKYTTEDVRYSQQLLLYKQMVELTTQYHIDAIEIDEIKLAMLEEVPMLKSGKPSTDKRKLGLVTHEAYHSKLVELGLDGDPDYDLILSYLMDRGHPLFRRTTVQIVDENIIHENIIDFEGTVKAIKNEKAYPRNRGYMCKFCGYKDLCTFDYTSPDPMDRQLIIQSMYKKDD